MERTVFVLIPYAEVQTVIRSLDSCRLVMVVRMKEVDEKK